MVRNPSLSKLMEDGHIPLKARKSLGEETADTLRELILLEKLAPGTSVPERDLAELLGISRTPMREAMRLLETEGLIEYTSTRRPYVANPTFDDICQYLAVIGALEALGGELACQVASDMDLDKISALNDKMQQTSDTEAALSFFELDMQFHSSIVQATADAAPEEVGERGGGGGRRKAAPIKWRASIREVPGADAPQAGAGVRVGPEGDLMGYAHAAGHESYKKLKSKLFLN